MNPEIAPVVISPSNRSTWQRIAPIATLLLLAPIIGELLIGATRLSYLFVLVPEIMVWGCGALMIREAVRRWHGGGTSLLLLGLALSIAEEFIIQQTSLAPLPWPGANPSYARVWGVNWIYFLFMLGYECVWVVLVPVQVTELIFRDRRHEPWLRTRGFIISGLVFILGSYIAWFAWTQRARPVVFHAAKYQPPRVTITLGALAIVTLVLTSYALAKRKSRPAEPKTSRTPPPWLVVLGTLVMGFPWYWLIGLMFVPRHLAPWIPMLAGICWAALSIAVVKWWSAAPRWQDMHRWAIALGALVVCMVAGFPGSSSWPKGDLVFKVAINVIAFVWMVYFGRRIHARTIPPSTQ